MLVPLNGAKQRLGRLEGRIGWDPSVSKSNHLCLDIPRLVFINERVLPRTPLLSLERSHHWRTRTAGISIPAAPHRSISRS